MAARKSNFQLISEYKEQKRLLDEKFSSLEKREAENFAGEKAETEEDSSAALRSKYVAERNALRKLPQVASASGISGGAVKSLFRSTKAEFGSSREKLISERDRAIEKLVSEYSQSGEKNSQSYAEKLASLRRRYASVLGMVK